MTARERILTLRLLEKQKKNPILAKKLGIEIQITENPIKEVKNNV